MPLEENPFIVPHFKALISCQNYWGVQRCGSTLSLRNALVEISILLHMMASDWFILSTAVFYTYSIPILIFVMYEIHCQTQKEYQKVFGNLDWTSKCSTLNLLNICLDSKLGS